MAHFEGIPFLAPDDRGFKYRKGDYKRLCAMTPFPLNECPIALFRPDFIKGMKPPKIRCGWLLGQKGLCDVMISHFPNHVAYDPDGRVVKDQTMSNLCYAIRERYDIPEDLQYLCTLAELGDSDGKRDYAIVIGSNYGGILPLDNFVYPMSKELFDGQEPRWYLAPDKFRWRRHVSRGSSTCLISDDGQANWPCV